MIKQNLRKLSSLDSQTKCLSLLCVLIVIKAIWAFYEISVGYINLDPDEAQYWTWSRNLDFGYYSKPPGIAWQIWLGCKIFGQTELGVRSMSVLISSLSTLALFWGGTRAQLPAKLSLWAALIFAFSPIGMMGSFAATTDGGFILFWTLSLIPFFVALENDQPPNYLLISLFILLGSLFKWPIYLLWIPIVLMSFLKRRLYDKSIFSAMALSLCGLIPSIIWNSIHGWPTFKHALVQSTTMASKGNFWEFFGAQFAILSPILFILLLLAIAEGLKLRKTLKPSLFFCLLTTLLVLGAFLVMSSFKKVQANWALYAYPTSTYLIAWYGGEQIKRGFVWLVRGIGLSLTMTFLLSSLPFLHSQIPRFGHFVSYKLNPFQRCVGWQALKEALSQIEFSDRFFLFADNYQLTSILSFYGPQQERQYFFNTNQRRQNQFCYWPTMADEKVGQTGYYVWTRSSKNFLNEVSHEVHIVKDKLGPFFSDVELLKIVPLFYSANIPVKGALIFKCSNYNGKSPKEEKRTY